MEINVDRKVIECRHHHWKRDTCQALMFQNKMLTFKKTKIGTAGIDEMTDSPYRNKKSYTLNRDEK